MDSLTICRLVTAGKYALSKHAEKEREADKITVEELEAALRRSTIIEDYPSDPRGPSCLVLGHAGTRPVHAVCAVKPVPTEVLIITVYDSSKRPEKWSSDYRSRKE